MTRITFTRGVALSGVTLIAGAVLLSACAGTNSTSSASGNAPGAAPMHKQAAFGSAAGVAQPPNGPAAASGAGKLQPARLTGVSSVSIIYTANVTLRSADAMSTARKAIAIVASAGGYTAGEHAVSGQPGGQPSTVTLTLKVPVAVYPQVLSELSAPSLGKQLGLQQEATDVTQQVANVNSLVASQAAAIAALRGLLKHAADVSQLLQVQQQISYDESTLESLQAQQRSLDHETSFATVSMTLLSVHHKTAKKHAHKASHNFLTGLTAGWRAFRHAAGWLFTAVGTVLPFILLAAILAAAGIEGRRRYLRRRTSGGPATS